MPQLPQLMPMVAYQLLPMVAFQLLQLVPPLLPPLSVQFQPLDTPDTLALLLMSYQLVPLV